MDYIIEELLAVELSRHLRDGETGFVGVGTGGKAFIRALGIPAVAARLAQLSHAPNYQILFGPIIDPLLDSGDIPETNNECDLINWPCHAQILAEDVLAIFKRGKMDIGFVTAPQIDRYGNFNIVCIGDYDHPKVRFPGVLAQADHLAYAGRTIAIMHHDRRTFVERVDFVSGCGHNNRKDLRGGGPALILTPLGVMDFEPESGGMRLKSVHPGVTLDDIRENTGFEMIIPDDVPVTQPPTAEQLELIRTKIDPRRKWLNAAITQEPASLV